MATTLTSNTFSVTYKDDYADSDQYYRLLFNAGKALQARELTQMQTIIQNEIARFGRNIFKEGSVVSPGGVTINSNYEFIKLDVTNPDNAVPSPITSLVGKQLTADDGLKVKVVEAIDATDGGDPPTIYVEYTDTSAGTSGSTPIRIGTTRFLTVPGYAKTLKTASSNASGIASKISISRGEFFVQDHFVFAPSQELIISKYSATPTTTIGFKINQEIVTVADNTALYDNQGATPNLSSPGADRYRIRLTLIDKANITASDNFVYLASVVNGSIVDMATTDTSYNVINDVLALRTKEESGNYVVRDFKAKFNSLNDSNIQLNVTDGTAYIDGYRLSIPESNITVSKARDTKTVNNQSIGFNIGNYIIGNGSNNSGLPDPTALEKVNLNDDADYGGAVIGNARVRAIENVGGEYRFFLVDIRMASGSSISQVRSFGSSVSDFVNIVTEAGICELHTIADNSLIKELPNTKPSSQGISDIVITVQKRTAVTAGATGSFTAASLAGATSGDTFVNTGDFIACKTDGTIASGVTFSGAGSSTASWTGGSSGGTYEIICYVQVGTPDIKNKTLQADQERTYAWPTDALTDSASGLSYIDLKSSDVYKVSAIKVDDSDGADLSANFIFDNGQRDNFYAKARLIAKSGTSVPSGNIFVKYDWFKPSTANGNFFAVNSYHSSNVAYENIPSYTKNNGAIVSLRDALDFRPVQDSDGTYNVIFTLPQNADVISADIEYNLPRRDKLVAKTSQLSNRASKGALEVVKGVPSFNPQYPETPTGSMALYNIDVNPYTLSESDVSMSIISNKRFTMKDIARLETRLNNLEELTTLSLLETSAATLNVLDSAGNARTKSGFIVDNFSNFNFSNTSSTEYRASIDRAKNILTPTFNINSIRMLANQNDGERNQTSVRGDLLMLSYTQDSFAGQTLATAYENINPFAVIKSTSLIELSPSSDDWVETRFTPEIVVDGGEVVNRTGETQWVNNRNSVRSNWFGTDGTEVITGSRVLRDIIGERVVDLQFIPFMRSKKIAFAARGLTPNTKHFPFFAGQSVSSWVTDSVAFSRFSGTSEEYGDRYINATSHPEGAADLVSDSAGVIYGSFFIPSTSSIKFRTGSKVFKLLDINSDNENAATSIGTATFTSTGALEQVERTVRTTRVIDVARLSETNRDNRDPLAQSFLVNQLEYPNGMFLTTVRTFFATKDDAVPVQVQIRTMENGIPTEIIVPGATKFLLPASVNIPTDTDDLDTIKNAPTDFTFDEPIYLAPNQRYAIVLLAESTEYNVYVAETYEFLLGSDEARVAKQPALGSLFKSQNGAVWTPDQTTDLMFVLFKANFDTSGTAVLENASQPSTALPANPITTESDGTSITVYNPGHGFAADDRVNISGISSSIAGIPASELNGTHTITAADWTGYQFASSTSGSASLRGGGSSIVATRQSVFDEFIPSFATNIPTSTSIAADARFTLASNWTETRNTTGSGHSYSKDDSNSYVDIIINELNFNDNAKLIASDSNNTLFGSEAKSTNIRLNFTTTDTNVSPVIDLQRSTLLMIENQIDKQDSASISGFNVPLSFVAETDPVSGSSASKHITTPVTLENPAQGLKILLAANRPSAADFEVYYRVSTGDESLFDKSWIEVNKENSIPADEDRTIFREYEYLAGGQGGDLPLFTTFQLKVVFTSTNTSKIATIKDLRAIALAV